MAKYSTEFKMKVVREYLESNISYKSLSDKYCIPSEIPIINWVNAYKSQGYEGLKVKRKNTQYTFEFKLNVVNLYLTGEMSYQSLANELKINNPSLITRWVNDFREKGIEGLKPKKRGRPSKMPKSQKKSKNIKVNSSTNLTKLENKDLSNLLVLGKCFSDSSRIKIFYALETFKEMCVCDLAEVLDASIATTSHHLRYLKKQGVAKSRKDGKEVYYSLANEEILSTIRIVLDMPNSLSLTS